ncbi:hypothetical protein [Bradyrhizobium diazoefficiens]
MTKRPGADVPNSVELTIRHGVPDVQAHCGTEFAGTACEAGGVKVAGS